MTATITEKPRTVTYNEKVEKLLASGSPVRLLVQYAKVKAATGAK